MRIGCSLASKTALILTLLATAGPSALAQAGNAWVDPPADSGAAPQAAPAPNPPASGEPTPSPQAAPSPESDPPAQAASPPLESAPPAQSAQPSEPAPTPDAPTSPQSAQPSPSQAPPPARPPAIAAQPRDSEKNEQAARAEAAKAFVVSYLNSWSASNESALDDIAEFYAPRILFHGKKVSLKRLFSEKRRFVRRWPERDYRPREDAIGIECKPNVDICTVHMVFDYTAANPKRGRFSQGTGALQIIVEFIGDKPVIIAEHSTLLSQTRKRNLALEDASNE